MRPTFIPALALSLIAPLAGAQTTPPASGLQLHLRADVGVTVTGGLVTNWADQSGNGYDFAPPAGEEPTLKANVVNGLPGVRFDGSTELRGDLQQTLTEATFVTLSRYTVFQSANDYLYTVGNRTGAGSQMSLSRLNDDDLYHFDGSATNSERATCIPPNAFLPTVQIYGDGSPDAHAIYQNGALELSSTASSNYSVDAGTFILGNYTTGNFQFVGDIVEVLVYNRALSTTEREQAEAYLRERAALAFADLGSAEVIQYEINAQPDATWSTCAADTSAQQATNADPSILLTDVESGGKLLRGTMSAGNAPDYLGFAFGYEDRSSYYLFDWKRTTASFNDFGIADAGMTLRAVNTLDGSDPTGEDLWSSTDTANVSTLCDNPMPWSINTLYDYTLRFQSGLIGIDIFEGEELIRSWSIQDNAFDAGRFGHYINSLQNVTYGPLSISDITSVDSDGDGVSDATDNCLYVANPNQRDTDGDGIGNFCDADLNNDCTTNVVDLGQLRASFFTSDPDADLNGDGVVNFLDLGLFRSLFFTVPGPSGQPHNCGCN
ncbi:MAG: thrombospondin type 3 repeat-containing protein [Pseudomonadota bacterium]